jgi:hypothetical protein
VGSGGQQEVEAGGCCFMFGLTINFEAYAADALERSQQPEQFDNF